MFTFFSSKSSSDPECKESHLIQIELPKWLAYSNSYNNESEKNLVKCLLPKNISEYIEYFKHPESEKRQIGLFNLLSFAIINQPYADDERDSVYFYGQYIYRPNHGTGSALRHVQYLKALLNYVWLNGSEKQRLILDAMTPEEKRCCELAVFLLRCGRTNEKSWNGDLSYAERSAFIFSYIANMLGYSKTIVETVGSLFNLKSEFKPDTKDCLLQELFRIAHEMDLVRCFYDTRNRLLKKENSESLFVATDQKQSVEMFYQYALTLCYISGSAICDNIINEDRELMFSESPALMNACISRFEDFANILESIQPETDYEKIQESRIIGRMRTMQVALEIKHKKQWLSEEKAEEFSTNLTL